MIASKYATAVQVLADRGKFRSQGAPGCFADRACGDLRNRGRSRAMVDVCQVGMTLSEALQLHPEQSADAVALLHSGAMYFSA
ncbi:hypothetical protein [Nocardia sp. NPDC057440]|uniref:hypothetical protein n=1 Tax=Nocardia sp. NPDC057440 TaxID=3346134 RepID=UPI00366EF30F